MLSNAFKGNSVRRSVPVFSMVRSLHEADVRKKKIEVTGSGQTGVSEQKISYSALTDQSDEKIENIWRSILDILSDESPALASNLSYSSLRKISDQSLMIEVNGNGFNINMIKRKKNMAVLKKVVSDFFNEEKEIVIEARVVSNNSNQEKKEVENRLKKAALSHPLVADTIEIFNGRIVDVKIL